MRNNFELFKDNSKIKTLLLKALRKSGFSLSNAGAESLDKN